MDIATIKNTSARDGWRWHPAICPLATTARGSRHVAMEDGEDLASPHAACLRRLYMAMMIHHVQTRINLDTLRLALDTLMEILDKPGLTLST